MKNSILDHEVKVLGETADRDLTSQLQDQLDNMFDDELERSVVGLKQFIDVERRVRTVTAAIRRALELRDGGCT